MLRGNNHSFCFSHAAYWVDDFFFFLTPNPVEFFPQGFSLSKLASEVEAFQAAAALQAIFAQFHHSRLCAQMETSELLWCWYLELEVLVMSVIL